MIKRLLFLSLTVFAAPSPAADTLPARPKGYVTDQARVLNVTTVQRLENLLTQFEKLTTVQIAVVTTPSLEGNEVDDFSSRLFKQWGIGQKGKDNGVLFLIAPNDRRMRIEVGYGLEGVITDGIAGRILDEAVLPQFKAGNIDAGVIQGTQILCQLIAQKSNIDITGISDLRSSPAPASKPATVGEKIFMLIILVFVIFALIRHPWLIFFFLSRGGGGGGGGFGGGGFGGFGGGGSGGGGASRGW